MFFSRIFCLLTVGGSTALIMRVVLDDFADDTEHTPKRGTNGVTNAVAADAKRTRDATREKRAIIQVFGQL